MAVPWELNFTRSAFSTLYAPRTVTPLPKSYVILLPHPPAAMTFPETSTFTATNHELPAMVSLVFAHWTVPLRSYLASSAL